MEPTTTRRLSMTTALACRLARDSPPDRPALPVPLPKLAMVPRCSDRISYSSMPKPNSASR